MTGWQELVSNLVTSAMWPLVLVVIILVFKEPLQSLINRIKALEAFGAKAHFGEAVRKLEQLADRVEVEQSEKMLGDKISTVEEDKKDTKAADGPEEEPKISPPGDTSASGEMPGRRGFDSGGDGYDWKSQPFSGPQARRRLGHLIEVASISPAAAIVDAWREVEGRLLEYWRVSDNPRDSRQMKARGAIDIVRHLHKSELISKYEVSLLDDLRIIRNQAVHNQSQPSEGQALGYIDAAEVAIQALDAIPRKRRRVLKSES